MKYFKITSIVILLIVALVESYCIVGLQRELNVWQTVTKNNAKDTQEYSLKLYKCEEDNDYLNEDDKDIRDEARIQYKDLVNERRLLRIKTNLLVRAIGILESVTRCAEMRLEPINCGVTTSQIYILFDDIRKQNF